MNKTPGSRKRHADKQPQAAHPFGVPGLEAVEALDALEALDELEELDDIDAAILDQLYAVHTLLDPPPADLADRVRFCLALNDLNVEVSRLLEEELVGSGARGTERTRTITFDSTDLTIMVSIVEVADDQVRLDGWLAPARRLEVELRVAGPTTDAADVSHFVITDETGRFVFPGVGHGLAQLLVRPPADETADGLKTVVTPCLML